MDNLQTNLQNIKGKESFFERMKRYIPGYDGYVNRDNSRELDTLLRNKLAMMLGENNVKIKNTVLNLSRAGKLFESQDIDKLDKKNQNATAKFRSAARGYSGAFDVVKIKEEKLNMLYDFDSTLLTEVEILITGFTELENNSAAGTDINNSAQKVSVALDNLLKKFDERELLLRSFQ